MALKSKLPADINVIGKENTTTNQQQSVLSNKPLLVTNYLPTVTMAMNSTTPKIELTNLLSKFKHTDFDDET